MSHETPPASPAPHQITGALIYTEPGGGRDEAALPVWSLTCTGHSGQIAREKSEFHPGCVGFLWLL